MTASPLFSRPLKIFFSGIGGSGMSALAVFMADHGHRVSGSDRAFDLSPYLHPARDALLARGITLVQQDGAGIDRSFDLAVFSTAVEPDQPEATKARDLGIPTKTRPGLLADIVAAFDTVAVAGTSGKSTTSGMLAFLMQRLGMDPSYIGGGRVKAFMTPVNTGNCVSGSSRLLVIEADESDGSIVHYRPAQTVILNLELDHHAVSETAAMFATLETNTRDRLIINSDDRNLHDPHPERATTFSLDGPSDYRAEEVVLSPFASEFTVRGVRMGLSIPGRHNIANALACIALLGEMGMDLAAVAKLLPDFTGIQRRFDIHLQDGDHLVIDDYAHNPHKIAAFMEAMQNVSPAVCYVFQPHGFGPTRMMRSEYVSVFASHLRKGDALMLLPIFYAGGSAAKDISSRDLADDLRRLGVEAEALAGREDLFSRLDKWRTWAVFGARDESLATLADSIARELRKSPLF